MVIRTILTFILLAPISGCDLLNKSKNSTQTLKGGSGTGSEDVDDDEDYEDGNPHLNFTSPSVETFGAVGGALEVKLNLYDANDDITGELKYVRSKTTSFETCWASGTSFGGTLSEGMGQSISLSVGGVAGDKITVCGQAYLGDQVALKKVSGGHFLLSAEASLGASPYTIPALAIANPNNLKSTTVSLITEAVENVFVGLRDFAEDADTMVNPTASEKIILTEVVYSLMEYIHHGVEIDFVKVKAKAQSIDYDVQNIMDTDTGIEAFLLKPVSGTNRGWGVYAFNKSPTKSVAMEGPDCISELMIGVVTAQAFNRTGAGALLLAGAHKNNMPAMSTTARNTAYRASDVAHSEDTAFNIIHDIVIDYLNSVVQFHGIRTANYAPLEATTPQTHVLASNGYNYPVPNYLLQFATAVNNTSIPYATGIFGTSYFDILGNTINVQSWSGRNKTQQTYMINMSWEVRKNASYYNFVIDGLQAVLP